MNATRAAAATPAPHYRDLIALFDGLFAASHNTRLIKGDSEPVYLPADAAVPYHRVVFAHGFFSSALHEMAHWCIAGEQRRRHIDYGYWYAPDGRCARQQRLFEQVEVKPQALEWIFSQAAAHRFRVSADNLNGEPGDSDTFKRAVYGQVLNYCRLGLPARAERFRRALAGFYGTGAELDGARFDPADL